MNICGHPNDGLLVRYLDGELSDKRFLVVREHLASCSDCRHRQGEFASLSSEVQLLVAAGSAEATVQLRKDLEEALLTRSGKSQKSVPAKVMRRFAWGMTIAAILALVVLLAPHFEKSLTQVPVPETAMLEARTISINGENFVSLPYSNPDLPLNAPRIVEMRVPISSLASAGIVPEPVGEGVGDHTVLANVLLGLDGQPRGVHVLEEE